MRGRLLPVGVVDNVNDTTLKQGARTDLVNNINEVIGRTAGIESLNASRGRIPPLIQASKEQQVFIIATPHHVLLEQLASISRVTM
jgi:hypothetical protein